jgi:hypothetical protein
MVTRIVAAMLVSTLALGASWPARACVRHATCCQACERTEQNSLRSDCCRLADAEQRAASTQAREIPASPPDAAPPATPAVALTAPGAGFAIDLAWAPRWLSTSPPTRLRI